MRRPRSVVISLVALALTPLLHAGGRHLAIVVDTSSSMRDNDVRRYTMQLSQVLSDLVDSGDELSVIRMPAEPFSSCSAGVMPSLVLHLDLADRPAFKRELDRLIQFDTGTYFAAPIRTAISLLPRSPSDQRMLLVIADSGGLGNCESTLTSELLDLKRSGVTIAAINLGGAAGAFDSNPAFDFTTAALDAHGLVEAVALVYQRFLGAKQVQTGRVQNEIEVEIAPYVDEAFLVVAGDGSINALEGLGNPGAAAIDTNHRGGGATRGLDDVLRTYRIVRLQRPVAGRWRFRAAGLSDRAGWMLLQDSAVGVRLISPTTVPKGIEVPLEVELFDQRTGKRIVESSRLPGLTIDLDVDGRAAAFHDDGQGGDKQAGDGIFTVTTTFERVGETPLPVHVQSEFLDRRAALTANVIDAAWRLDVRTARRVEVDRPLALTVTMQPIGRTGSLRPPERIDVLTGGPVIELRDDGREGDQRAGDLTFTRNWTFAQTGTLRLDYVPVRGGLAAQVSAPLSVLGRLRFGKSAPVHFGRLGSESEGVGQLDLTSADVRGEFELRVTTRFYRQRSVLELDTGNGWLPLGEQPQTLRLADGGPKTWPMRLRIGECPEGHPAGRPFDVLIESTAADGTLVRTTVPVVAEIVPEAWLRCWWPAIALALGIIAVGVLIHGYWSPSRFPPRLGVVLSPEEDIDEGFFHPIRPQPGSGSGFYRDARIYICQDFRLSAKPRNAVARLRADRKLVRIEAASGGAVWRQTVDGVWEQIPSGESTVRFGDLYRNESASLFFELRNA